MIRDVFKRGLDQVLGFGAWDQHAFVYIKVTPEEFLVVRDVLGRLAFEPFTEIAAVMDPLQLFELVAAVSVKIGAVAMQSVAEQNLCCEARHANRCFFENLSALL